MKIKDEAHWNANRADQHADFQPVFSIVEEWANRAEELLETGLSFEAVCDQVAEEVPYSGLLPHPFVEGMVVGLLFRCWARGDEFWAWWQRSRRALRRGL